jgi:hypothetical protein
MSFFNWIPSESDAVISPWIAVYCGLTLIFTGGTYWWWRVKMEDEKTTDRLVKGLDIDWMV